MSKDIILCFVLFDIGTFNLFLAVSGSRRLK